MPGAFEKAEAAKPFVFTRVVQNTDYILKTPEGRAMATAQALGYDIASLFGAKKTALPPASKNSEEPYTPSDVLEPESENSAADTTAETVAEDEPDFPEDSEGKTKHEETEFDRLTGTLEEYMTFKEYLNVTTKSGTNPYKLAEEELNSSAATEDSRKEMITRLRDFLIAKKVPGVA
jgi:hypothetical protein